MPINSAPSSTRAGKARESYSKLISESAITAGFYSAFSSSQDNNNISNNHILLLFVSFECFLSRAFVEFESGSSLDPLTPAPSVLGPVYLALYMRCRRRRISVQLIDEHAHSRRAVLPSAEDQETISTEVPSPLPPLKLPSTGLWQIFITSVRGDRKGVVWTGWVWSIGILFAGLKVAGFLVQFPVEKLPISVCGVVALCCTLA